MPLRPSVSMLGALVEDQDCEHEWTREIGMYGNAEIWESEHCELCDMERDGDVLR